MAVTKTLKAVPYLKGNKVHRWELSAIYENDTKDDPTFYSSEFQKTIDATAPDGSTNFTKKAKGSWTKSEIESLMPITRWDDLFEKQVTSVITNPITAPVADMSYQIPSS